MLSLMWCFLPNSFKAMMQWLSGARSGFLNLSTIDILGQIILEDKGHLSLFTEECLAEHPGPWPPNASGITPCHKKTVTTNTSSRRQLTSLGRDAGRN